MKKIVLFVSLILFILLVLPPSVLLADTAKPSQTNFVMNKQAVSVTATYSIDDTNYLQLRAIAALLNGTSSQFNVGWDGQYAVIEPGKAFSSSVSQTELRNTTNVRKSNTKFSMNGEVFSFVDARLIDGDTNYIQLREFAQKLSGTASQFNVYWDDPAGKAVIQPGVAYSGLGPQSSISTPKATGGIARTINLDNLLTFEVSNTYAYASVLGYDPLGVSVIHFLVVSEGAEVKCTKYVPPYNTPAWQENEYMVSPFTNIYFESGALWPTVSYKSSYDDRERAKISQGRSIIVNKGIEYTFDTSTSDPTIKSKYGDVGAAFYALRIFVVPADTAAQIGGSAPEILGKKVLQDYFVPNGAGSTPVTYVSDSNAPLLEGDRWYVLMYDHVNNVLTVEINAQGNAELRDGTRFYVENKENSQVSLRMADGRYLGVEGTVFSGTRVRAVSSPFMWNLYFENNGGFFGNNRYSLRPTTNHGLALTTSGEILDGTAISLVSQANLDAPKTAEFTFYPSSEPTTTIAWKTNSSESESALESGKPLADGVYTIKSAKDENYIFDVNGSSTDDGAKVIVYKNNGGSHQQFKLTQIKGNQYTIQNVHSEKWLISKGTVGAALVQSGSVSEMSAKTFSIVKQSDGSYRITDSKGLFLGITGGKIANGTPIILWNKASDASQTYTFEKLD